MTIYLKADGAKGNVSMEGYQGWISIYQFRFGVNQGVDQRTGSMYNRIKGGPSLGLVHLLKFADSSSTFWFKYGYSNETLSQVQIDFVTTGNPPFTYQSIVLTNAFVSHYSQEYGQGSVMTLEKLILAYDTIEQSFTPRQADNQPGNPIRVGYDVSQGIKM